MKINEALKQARQVLLHAGKVVQTKRWQGKEAPPPMIEIVQSVMMMQMEQDPQVISDLAGATQPWAEIHFGERVSGEPLNPPPSHTMWLTKTEEYLADDAKFDHTYPERMWPKTLGMTGVRFDIGDLQDVVEVLKNDPNTRQAVMPMFSYEDITAAKLGKRVPCSIAWNFMIRDGKMHCTYPLRSCDAVRHLHNDIYFANMLVLWIINQLPYDVVPGTLQMPIMSLHCFENDKYALTQMIKKD